MEFIITKEQTIQLRSVLTGLQRLYYFGARFYDPTVARFMTQDSTESAQSAFKSEGQAGYGVLSTFWDSLTIADKLDVAITGEGWAALNYFVGNVPRAITVSIASVSIGLSLYDLYNEYQAESNSYFTTTGLA